MGRYEFELATRADDADLRRILRTTPMPGDISLAFCCEPSFFDASVVHGPFQQVVVGRDMATRQAVGFGCRSVRQRYVNGQSQPIGYLSLLRLLEPHRQSGLVARGYRYFRQLHADQRAPMYLTTIAQGNERALATLTQGRAGLPGYYPAGDYHTAVIPIVRSARRQTPVPTIEVRPATRADLGSILPFLSAFGPGRQFFPCYTACDFFAETGTLRDLHPGDLLLAFRQQRLVGLLGGWDQQRFRQTVVHRLSRRLRWSRPFYNRLASLWGWPRLPRPGQPFPHVIAALPVVEDDNAAVFRALLDRLLAQLVSAGHEYLLVGMHASDPLLPVATRRATTTYVTRLYYVGWADSEPIRRSLDGRPPYLELGCL